MRRTGLEFLVDEILHQDFFESRKKNLNNLGDEYRFRYKFKDSFDITDFVDMAFIIEEDLFKKLEDFEYWKNWKTQRDETKQTTTSSY